MIVEHAQILANLKKKIYHPLYFLFGDESYYTDVVTDYINDHVLTESEKAFNQTVLYGKEITVDQLFETVGRLPMMSSHQVVIVKEAQELGKLENLAPYLDRMVPSTILVLAYKHKKVDKRKTFFKNLLKHPQVVAQETKALRDYQVEGWLTKYLRSKKLEVDAVGVALLAEFLGTDLSKIVHEVDKLILIKGDDKKVTPDDIEKNIGVSKDYNVFELTNALGERNHLKVNKILHYFSKNPKSLVLPMALGNIFSYYNKVYLTKLAGNLSDNEMASMLKVSPFFVKDYRKYASKYGLKELEEVFTMLEEYDLKSKGMGATNKTEQVDLLKELTSKVLTH